MEKKQRVKLLTPVGRLCFPAIFEKEKPMKDATTPPKYAATIVFDKEYLRTHKDEAARYQAIKALCNTACIEKFKKPLDEVTKTIPRFWNPFRDGAEKEHLDGFGAGTIFFKASSNNRRPGAVGPDTKTPIDDKEALYPGCYVRLSIGAYAFDNKMKGVAIGLNSVMFVRDGERLDGGSDASEDFGEFNSGETETETDDFL